MKTKKVKLLEVGGISDIGGPPSGLTEFIAWLQEQLNSVPEEFRETARCEATERYGESYFSISYLRPLNAAEQAEQDRRDQVVQVQDKFSELQQLATLLDKHQSDLGLDEISRAREAVRAAMSAGKPFSGMPRLEDDIKKRRPWAVKSGFLTCEPKDKEFAEHLCREEAGNESGALGYGMAYVEHWPIGMWEWWAPESPPLDLATVQKGATPSQSL